MRPDEKGKKLANDILDYVNNLACNEEIFAKTISPQFVRWQKMIRMQEMKHL